MLVSLIPYVGYPLPPAPLEKKKKNEFLGFWGGAVLWKLTWKSVQLDT